MSRFDGWEEQAEVKSVVVSKGEEPGDPVKEEPKTEQDDTQELEASEQKNTEPKSDEPEEIKGLKTTAFKLREQKRQLKEELAKTRAENEELKSKKQIEVDDFDTFEDYEAALQQQGTPDKSKPDPIVIDAVAALSKKFEKAGLDVEDMREAMSEMKHLPDSMILALSDRKDGAIIAKWLAENEDSEEAQEALRARTETGRMRNLDDIAVIAAKGKKANNQQGQPVETITRVNGGNVQPKNLDGLPPAEFEKAVGGGRGSRWDW